MAEHRTSDLTPGPGGVMTDEVGVVTGELTVCTAPADGGGYTVRVQYKDADEWYTPTGMTDVVAGAADVDAAHAAVLAKLGG